MQITIGALLLLTAVNAWPAAILPRQESTTLQPLSVNTAAIANAQTSAGGTAQTTTVTSTTLVRPSSGQAGSPSPTASSGNGGVVPAPLPNGGSRTGSAIPSSAASSAMQSESSDISLSADGGAAGGMAASESSNPSPTFASGGSPEPTGTGIFAAPSLPSASSAPFSTDCPTGYQSGTHNLRRELGIPATNVAPLISNFQNMTWQSTAPLQQTSGLDEDFGLGQFAGATRRFTVNGIELAETLTNYQYDPPAGTLDQLWVLSNGRLNFGGENSGIATYSSRLQIGPAEGNASASTLDWNTQFCVQDIPLYEGFFMKLHEPAVDYIAENAV